MKNLPSQIFRKHQKFESIELLRETLLALPQGTRIKLLEVIKNLEHTQFYPVDIIYLFKEFLKTSPENEKNHEVSGS